MDFTSQHSGRFLTVGCLTGLSNRLKVLTSGLALAEASSRNFEMWWPRNSACSAAFSELFTNQWKVTTYPSPDVQGLKHHGGWRAPSTTDLLADQTVNLRVRANGVLIDARQFPAHAPLETRRLAFFRDLTPRDELFQTIENFRRAHFRPFMIGVHLRRGDFVRFHGDTVRNTQAAMQLVDKSLSEHNGAGILLCSDDGADKYWDKGPTAQEGVHRKFKERYGERVIWRTPASLDRRAPSAIKDAVVDLWLLRQTQVFIGTKGSTFSELTTYGRNISATLCAGRRIDLFLLEWALRGTGIFRLLQRRHQRDLGAIPPSGFTLDQVRSLRILSYFSNRRGYYRKELNEEIF